MLEGNYLQQTKNFFQNRHCGRQKREKSPLWLFTLCGTYEIIAKQHGEDSAALRRNEQGIMKSIILFRAQRVEHF